MSLDSLENTRKRLIFRSEHRGTKEMDLLLGSFAKKYVPEFTEDELVAYEELLKENDPNLYNWITGQEEAPANIQSDVFERLKNHKFA
ncbi:MAG: succinate dehydrogenase assembly factor 2 [Alphaproteobacteria bacterium]|nr:succinate dehydrogenase assembly factor 2 [Alphaproteobacteria bacterium]